MRAPVLLPGATAPPIRDGAVLVEEGRIVAVGPHEELRQAQPHAQPADHGGTVLLPGLVDGHSHARGPSLTAFGDRPRSLEELCAASGFWTGLDPHDDALVAGADLIATGVTAVQAIVQSFLGADEYEELVAGWLAGFRDAGIGVELALGLTDQNEYVPPLSSSDRLSTRLAERLIHPDHGLDPEAYGDLFDRVHAQWSAPDRGVDVALGPVAPQWCSDDLLAVCAVRARAGARVHTHLHESPLQVSGAYGPRPLTRLERFGLVTSGLSVAHGVWLDEAEIELLATRDVTIVHCPGSNMHLGVGTAAVRRYRDAGIQVGLGLDSHSHVEPPDAFAEMRHAQAVAVGREEPITALEAFALATTGSASALGRGGSIGQLVPGARADMVALALTGIEQADDPVEHLVEDATRQDVAHVWVAGRTVRDGRGHVAEAAIATARHRLLETVEEDRPRLEREFRELEELRPWLERQWRMRAG